MKLADSLLVKLSPFEALAILRFHAWAAEVGDPFSAGEVREAVRKVGNAIAEWMAAPELPLVEAAPVGKGGQEAKRKRGRPRKDGAAPVSRKPDVFEEAKAERDRAEAQTRLVEEHPATKGAAPAILGGAQ